MEKWIYEGENQKKIERFLLFIFTLYNLNMVIAAFRGEWENWLPVFWLIEIAVIWIIHIGKYGDYTFRAKWMTIAMQASLIVYFTQLEDISEAVHIFMVFEVLMGMFGIPSLVKTSVLSAVFIYFFHIVIVKTITFSTTGEIVTTVLQFGNIMLLEYIVYTWTKKNSEGSKQLLAMIEELQAVENRKDDFLANVSHEIRTPINTICGMSELLLSEELPYKIKEKIQNIQMSGRNLMSVVSDILDFSELVSGNMELEEEVYNITSTINDVINMTLARKNEKNLELIVDCTANIPSALLGDEKKLRRVIMNLVDNAIKFTDEGGVSIAIDCRKESYGINLMVTVTDTGIGMDEAAMEKLFTSFNQVDSRRNRMENGLGLGLAISQALVQKMGGAITVKSRPGKGTIVKFVIPQKVVEEMPIASLTNVAEINVATYINMEQFDVVTIRDEYSRTIINMVEQLNAVGRCQVCRNLSELQRREAKERFSHVFISDVEYREDRAYFDALAERTKLVIIMDPSDEKHVNNTNVLKIYKPFYILSIVSVLNGDYEREEAGIASMRKFVTRDAHVLVVDDNRMNIRVVEGLLANYKIKVTIATSGQEALDKIISADYDFVFMDYMMPEMDGVEALRRIRQKVGTYYQKVPVIALTANAVAGTREMLIGEGFTDFLEKPIERSVLERVLKRNLPYQKIVYVDEENTGVQVTDKAETYDAKNAFNERSGGMEEAPESKGINTMQENASGEEDGLLSMEELEKELSKEGLDVEKGILYCNGKAQYISVLQGYCEDSDALGMQAAELFSKKDWKNYVITVHGIKGAMRSIGATNVSELARKLEVAGKEGNITYILDNHDELMNEYNMLFMSLRQKAWLCPQNAAAKEEGRNQAELPTITENEFGRILSEMEATMYVLDGDKLLELMSELCKYQYHGTALETLWNPVKRKVEMSDYISAVEMVARLKRKLDDGEVS